MAAAAWAMGAAGVRLLDFMTTWRQIQDLGVPLVLHDPLCPLTPVSFLRAALAAAGESVVVGVRPVTDTIKVRRDALVGPTVDRELLWTVTSPVVLPAAVVRALPERPVTDHLPTLVQTLRARFEVHFLEAPAVGGRVEDESALRLLEALADQQRTSEAAGPW